MVASISPILIGEEWEEGTNPSASIPYKVVGTALRDECYGLLRSESPDYVTRWNGGRLPRIGWRAKFLGGSPGAEVWECAVKYGRGQGADDSPPGRQFEISFDTGGGTFKITQALAHVQSYAPSGVTPPDHKGAIGVTKDGVEGCEIVVPSFTWQERHKLRASIVTDAYIANLRNLVGRTNDAAFRAHPIDAVLCLSVTGELADEDNWDLSFKFAGGVHVTGQAIGDITGIDKKAWDYLWVEYEDDTSNGHMVKVPKAVHVEQVYYQASYSEFHIPTGSNS